MSLTDRSKNVFQAVRKAALVRGDDSGDWEPDYNRPEFVRTDALPGSAEKIAMLAERAKKGLPLWHQDDRRNYETDDPAFFERLLSSGRAVRTKTREGDDDLFAEEAHSKPTHKPDEQTEKLLSLVIPPAPDHLERLETARQTITEEPVALTPIEVPEAATDKAVPGETLESLTLPSINTILEPSEPLSLVAMGSDDEVNQAESPAESAASLSSAPVKVKKNPVAVKKKRQTQSTSMIDKTTSEGGRGVKSPNSLEQENSPRVKPPKRSEVLAMFENLKYAVAMNTILPSELERFTQEHIHILSSQRPEAPLSQSFLGTPEHAVPVFSTPNLVG
jgi:hypothetical protein